MFINPTNLRMLRAWRGNGDVKLVADPYGTLEYVTSAVNYSTKHAEPSRVRLETRLRAALRALPETATTAQQIAKVFNSRQSMTLVSLQKAVTFLLCSEVAFAWNSEDFRTVIAFPDSERAPLLHGASGDGR